MKQMMQNTIHSTTDMGIILIFDGLHFISQHCTNGAVVLNFRVFEDFSAGLENDPGA
jgi:hypothetical protein